MTLTIRRVAFGFLASVLALAQAPAVVAQPSTSAKGLGFDVGLRLGTFDLTESDRTYDLLYDGDVMTQVGIELELRLRRRFLITLSYDSGAVDGQRVIPSDPIVFTGIPDELTLEPLQLTVGWLFLPAKRWQPHLGVGATWLSWENESLGERSGDTDSGTHFVAGVRRQLPRWSIGLQARQSSVPDAIGDSGLPRLLGEDDLGGLSLHLVLRWRLR